ncbi:hypothetical protein FOPG_18309 [Fusarium oxysporum f. sp. conglutinans race 2 54008]|uniref:Uncharacterized protein n=1 Tax=Fusarium oxysporum f. sp. conglutinans race 2 54008 TaxID=1089457 RepID=X0GQ73_FUSOX|nr:hypothetical protein FOPG_18309 [Fusarium oxysporum f. sp. conglutinans race 2 54008]
MFNDYRGQRDTARYLHQPYRMGELLQTSNRPLDRDYASGRVGEGIAPDCNLALGSVASAPV